MTKVTATTKKINMAALRNSVKSAVAGAASEEQRKIAQEAAQRAKELYEEATRGWDGGAAFKNLEQSTAPGTALKRRADNRKTYPNLTFKIGDLVQSSTSTSIKVSTDNPLFKWLDRGTEGMTVSGGGTVMIMTINGHATVPGVMGIKKPTAGPWVPVKETAGIVARGWSEKIARQIEEEFSKGDFQVKVELDG